MKFKWKINQIGYHTPAEEINYMSHQAKTSIQISFRINHQWGDNPNF